MSDWIDDLVEWQMTESPAARRQFGSPSPRPPAAGLSIPFNCARTPQGRVLETDGSEA